MTCEASRIWVLVLRGREINLLLVRERSRRLLRSQGLQSPGYSGQRRVRVASQDGQMVCYHCKQSRHMRRDCPQRHGSRGFGTVQSQSGAGQERTQFVSPNPSMGQRD